MRLFISLLLLMSSVQAEDIKKLTILHSNDLHARLTPDANHRGGFAHLATLVRRELAGCDHCLYLNAGDLVQGTPVSTIFRGEPVYTIGNKLKFDVSTIGNHEFDYGYAQLEKFLRMAKYPIVSANIVDQSGKLIAKKPYVIKKVNGLRVAIIGSVMSDLEGFLKPMDLGPWHSSPAKDAVAKYASELRNKADVVIVLGHIHQKEGSEIIAQVPQVNVVVEGHGHAGRKELEVVDGRVAVGCAGYGVDLCRLDLEVNKTQKKLVSWKWTKIPVDANTIPAASDVEKLVAKWEKRVSDKVDRVIGEAKRNLEKRDLTPLIEQATLEEMHADFTVMNAGGVRDRLVKGPIMERQIWNIIPFDNVMMTATLRGSEIPEVIRKGRTVEPDKEYLLAMSDFLATNPVSIQQLGLQSVKFRDTDLFLRDELLNWVKKKKILE